MMIGANIMPDLFASLTEIVFLLLRYEGCKLADATKTARAEMYVEVTKKRGEFYHHSRS